MARFRLALLTLVAVIVCGMAGYVVLQGWTWFEGLYMTIITLSTVGYTEVRPLDFTGRVYTLVLIVAGRTAEVYAVVVFTQVLVVEHLRGVFGRRRMEKLIARLSRHYIICGWGRMGQEIVEQFQHKRVPFVVVETDGEKYRQLTELGIPAIQGDGADDAVLRAAGIERAAGLIAVAPGDADNIFITLSARALKPGLFIVARCAHEQDIQKLRVAGANQVVSPYVIGARRIAAAAFHPAVSDFLDQEIRHDHMEWELEDVPITPRARFTGRTLRDSGIRQETGCIVLAIRDGQTARFLSNPPPDTVLRAGDTLIALGTPEQLVTLEEMAGLAGEPGGARP